SSANAAGFTKLEDKALRVRPSVEKDTYTIVARTSLEAIAGFQLEVLPDDTSRKTAEQPKENRFTLTSIKVQSTSQKDEKKDQMVSLRNARADFSPLGFPVTNAIDASSESGWLVSPKAGQPHWALFDADSPVGGKDGTILTFMLELQSPEQEEKNFG